MKTWQVIDHTFKFRVGDSDEKGGCTFIGGSWKDVTTKELFENKKVVLFSLPGAFTPTCSGQQLPAYDEAFEKKLGDLICSVRAHPVPAVLHESREFYWAVLYLVHVWMYGRGRTCDATTPDFIEPTDDGLVVRSKGR